jgi:hypothetical protein
VGSQDVTEPVHQVFRRIEPVTRIDRAADDHRVIAVDRANFLRRDHRRGQAPFAQRLPDGLRDLGGRPMH